MQQSPDTPVVSILLADLLRGRRHTPRSDARRRASFFLRHLWPSDSDSRRQPGFVFAADGDVGTKRWNRSDGH